VPQTKSAPARHADFFVLIGQPGRIEDAIFIDGDEQFRSMAAALRTLPLADVFPDDQRRTPSSADVIVGWPSLHDLHRAG
jgi:hypothetical protein